VGARDLYAAPLEAAPVHALDPRWRVYRGAISLSDIFPVPEAPHPNGRPQYRAPWMVWVDWETRRLWAKRVE
jgi:hypothetical protein